MKELSSAFTLANWCKVLFVLNLANDTKLCSELILQIDTKLCYPCEAVTHKNRDKYYSQFNVS